MYFRNHSDRIVKAGFFNSQILGAILIISYCIIYGVTANVILSGLKLLFFLSSMVFALSVIYIRDPHAKKENARKGIILNQVVGTTLLFSYIVVFGVSSISMLNGFQLIYFMSSYTFVMSIFYIRDPERIKKVETATSSTTTSTAEKNPCFINSQDLSWLIRGLNGPLSVIIGFTELMLRREYTDNEKEYMLRNIYEQALIMSQSVAKVSAAVPDSLVRPKEICDVVDVLNNKKTKGLDQESSIF